MSRWMGLGEHGVSTVMKRWLANGTGSFPAMGVLAMGAVLLFVCGCSERGLNVRVRPGDRFNLVHTVNMKTVRMRDDSRRVQDSRAEWRFDLEVESVSRDGVSTFRVAIGVVRLKEWSNDGSRTVSLPSGLGGEDVFRQFARLVRGKSFKVSVGPLGGIRGVEGLDAIRQEVNSRLVVGGERATMPPDEQFRRAARQSIMRPLDDLLMASRFNGLFHVLPPAVPSAGDGWVNGEVPFPAVGAYETRSWTVESRENGVLTLSLSSRIRPVEQDGGVAISGEEHGTVVVDETTGLLTAWESSTHLAGSMDRRMSADSPLVSRASMTVDIESRAELSAAGESDKAPEGAR